MLTLASCALLLLLLLLFAAATASAAAVFFVQNRMNPNVTDTHDRGVRKYSFV